MNDQKLSVYNALCTRALHSRHILFHDAALDVSVKHLKTQDVHEIAAKFLREHPTFHAVRFLDPERRPETQSDFTSLVLTDCEYDDAVDAQKIHSAIFNKTGVHPCEKWISDDVQFSIFRQLPESGLLHLHDCGFDFQRTERYEYTVDYSRDFPRDASGDILDESIAIQNIRLLQIVITPTSAHSIYAKAGFPLNSPIVIDLDATIAQNDEVYLIPGSNVPLR